MPADNDYTMGDASVSGGLGGNLTISHNVGGFVLIALLFLLVSRILFEKHL